MRDYSSRFKKCLQRNVYKDAEAGAPLLYFKDFIDS